MEEKSLGEELRAYREKYGADKDRELRQIAMRDAKYIKRGEMKIINNLREINEHIFILYKNLDREVYSLPPKKSLFF